MQSEKERFLTRLGICAVLLMVAAVLFLLWPELSPAVPPFNEDVLHFSISQHLSQTIGTGGNILDPWITYWTEGFPIFHYMPPLPHWITAFLMWLLALDPMRLYYGVKYLLLCAFPFAVYFSARGFGFPVMESCLAAVLAPLISANNLCGLEYNSYVWTGFGLFGQLWGMVLLPLVLGSICFSLRSGCRLIWASGFLAILILSNSTYAYIALVTCGVLLCWPLDDSRWKERAWRLTQIVVPAMALSAFHWLPHLLDRQFLSRSIWDPVWKYDSYGAGFVFGSLAKGELFDFGRLPVYTMCIALGLLALLLRKSSQVRLPAALFCLWLLLYCGRPTWGLFVDFWPFADELFLHRFLGAVQLFGILIAAVGLGVLIRLATPAPRWGWPIPALLLLLAIAPAARERFRFFESNRLSKAASEREYLAQKQNLDIMQKEVGRLAGALPGRIYAGLGSNWGRNFSVGAVPFYAYLALWQMDALGHLYHSMALVSNPQLLFREDRFLYVDLFNVRAILAPKTHDLPSYLKLEKSISEWNLWSTPATSYFSLVRSTVAFTGDKRGFYTANQRWLLGPYLAARNNPAFYLGKENVPSGAGYRRILSMNQSSPLPPLLEDEQRPPQGMIISQKQEKDRFTVTISAEEPAVVLFKMSFHPNWHVTINGRDAELLLLSPGFMGARVATGQHEVVFRYDPGRLKFLLLMSGVLIAALCVWASRAIS